VIITSRSNSIVLNCPVVDSGEYADEKHKIPKYISISSSCSDDAD